MTLQVPFNRPTVIGSEAAYIQRAISRGHLAGDGEFTARCQQILEAELGTPKALLTTSCTHALEMAALLLDIQAGDEILAPAFTFTSTVNAFAVRGAKPRFVDIRPDTLNLDESRLAAHIRERTRAIVVMHYAGVGCEMDAIMSIARQYGLAVVEDNAHGLFGRYKGRHLGTFGALATQSFHATKNITCGEGGALLINDSALQKRAEVIREKGTNRSDFLSGRVDKYSWVDFGSSYLPSELLAAFLCAQLEVREQIQAARRLIWDRYQEYLSPWAQTQGVLLPVVPAYCDQAYHMFYVLAPSTEFRRRLVEHLKSRGIAAVFHYTPLHRSEMAGKLGVDGDDCPVTDDISGRLLRLPFYTNMTTEEQESVIAAVIAMGSHDRNGG